MRLQKTLLPLLALTCWLVTASADEVYSASTGADEAYPALRDSFDSQLQRGLETALRQTGLSAPVGRGQLAVALVDLTESDSPRVAAVNGDKMIYAASLPKIAILLGVFEEIEHGRMSLDRNTWGELREMIRVSSNSAATHMLNRVGKPKLANILRSPRYRLYDPKQNGGLWVGKDYAKQGVWRRDPLHNLSHGATALQTARFYYLLETGRLVSPLRSRQMKAMLANSGINHKFVKGLAGRPGAKVYRKSGSWQRWHADSALIEHDGFTYVAVGLVESPQGGEWLSTLIGPLDDLIRGRQGT
jgi:beta-lactamase class A